MSSGGPVGDGQQGVPKSSSLSLLGLTASVLATKLHLGGLHTLLGDPKWPIEPGLHRELPELPHAHQGFPSEAWTWTWPSCRHEGGWARRLLLRGQGQPSLPQSPKWAGLTALGGV